MLSEEILTPVDLSLNTGKSRDGEEDWVSVMTTFLLISSKILLPLSSRAEIHRKMESESEERGDCGRQDDEY